jgi:hypothetical protein
MTLEQLIEKVQFKGGNGSEENPYVFKKVNKGLCVQYEHYFLKEYYAILGKEYRFVSQNYLIINDRHVDRLNVLEQGALEKSYYFDWTECL